MIFGSSKAFGLNNKLMFGRYGQNQVSAMIPEFWANDVLTVLYSKVMMPFMVHRDYENRLQKFGDVVNARRPSKMKAFRKDSGQIVTDQAIVATNIPITLNQHIYTSFLIDDRDISLSMMDLSQIYSVVAAEAIGQTIELCLMAQLYQFLDNCVGALGSISASNIATYMIAARKGLDDRYVPDDGRMLVMGTTTESAALNAQLFTQAYSVGDRGEALQKGVLGQKYGLETFKHALMFNIITPYTHTATTTTAGYAVGVTQVAVTSVSNIAVGGWITLEGIPYWITAINSLVLTLHRPLQIAVANGDPVQMCNTGAVANGGITLPANFDQYFPFTATTAPQIGQMVTFTGDNIRYAIVDIMSGTLLLDRPLQNAINDLTVINFGPSGQFNLAFIREAIALVNRPLAAVTAGTGALSAVRESHGLAMRATIAYDSQEGAQRVKLDLLMGIQVLNTDMGEVILG